MCNTLSNLQIDTRLKIYKNWRNAIFKFSNCAKHIHALKATIPSAASIHNNHTCNHVPEQYDTDLIWVHCHEASSQSLRRDQRLYNR